MNNELLNHSMFKNIMKFLSNKVKQEGVEKIYKETCLELNKLAATANYRGSKSIEKHMKGRILPAISFYKVLQNNNVSKQKALNMVAEYTELETQKIAKVFRISGKLPGFYRVFTKVMEKILKSSYPIEGWKIEWIVKSKDKVAFNIKSCLYWEVFVQHGCGELTSLFCHTDEITYCSMSKHLKFERTETLARGNNCCNFCFIKQ